jgi:hypothetical protein
MSNLERIKNSLFWGIILWLIGYIAGVVLFFIMPKDYIGWVITPLATLITIYILIKMIKRPSLTCYFGLGLIWTIIAVLFDFIFIVKLFNSGISYYKSDVFLYYILTFTLPIAVGYWKFVHKNSQTQLF